MVRAVIVEDEPLARQTLRDFTAQVDWIEVVGEVEDGKSAVRVINKLEPDLLFLDVQMPELTGLEVLERLTHQPAVVFTTAYDHYAVAAFELEAVDYLVKPFGRKRFVAMLERVRRRLSGDSADHAVIDRATDALRGEPVRRMFARKGDTIVPLSVDHIVRAEAGDNYVCVYTSTERFLLNLSLGDLESRLDGERFRRIHRSHIINLDFVTAIEPYDDRRLAVTLRDGSCVVASRAGSQFLRGLVV
jgi:two-component system LytT family response regulator